MVRPLSSGPGLTGYHLQETIKYARQFNLFTTLAVSSLQLDSSETQFGANGLNLWLSTTYEGDDSGSAPPPSEGGVSVAWYKDPCGFNALKTAHRLIQTN